jgi:ribosomal protein S27E/ribosomal protein L37E
MRQTFVCPKCGHKSTHDQWDKPVYCSHCGYAPPSPESNRLRRLLSTLGFRHKPATLPTEQLAQMYTFLKEQNPAKIVLIRQEGALYAFGDDARTVAQVCGSHLLVDQTFKGLEKPTARIRFGGHQRCVNTLSKAGQEVLVADPSRWKPLSTFKSARRTLPLTPLSTRPDSARPSFVPFTCPACRYVSTYDPWGESAHCPRCGYTAAPLGASRQSSPTAETAGVITVFCPQCKLQVPYSVSNPAVRCPWCGYALPPLSQKALVGSRQLARSRDVPQDTIYQMEVDWRRMAAFMARILAWVILAALALLAIYLTFTPTIPLLFGAGLILLVVGLRNLKTREGTVSFRYVIAAPAHTFDVKGWQAVVLGLFRVLLGLGLVLFSSLPRVVELWGHLQRIFSWSPFA